MEDREILKVSYIVGDLQKGYENVIVSYRLIDDNYESFVPLETIMNHRNSYILSSEFSHDQNGFWEHSIISEKGIVVVIAFSEVQLSYGTNSRPGPTDYGYPFVLNFDD